MNPFIQRLAKRIEQPQPQTITDSLTDVGEIIRIWRFFRGDPAAGSAVVGPFSEDTAYPVVQVEDVDRLKQALITFVQTHPHHPQLVSAIHGLAYLAAPDTKELLVRVLQDCLNRDPLALYQTIIALESLGENLYGTRSSTSCDEIELNERIARRYLSSHSNRA